MLIFCNLQYIAQNCTKWAPIRKPIFKHIFIYIYIIQIYHQFTGKIIIINNENKEGFLMK